MLSRSYSLSLLLLLLAALFPSVQALEGTPAFHQEGYPTIAIIAITIILVLAIFAGAKNGSSAGLKSSIIFVIFNAYIWVAGLFLLFGPDGNVARPDVVGIILSFSAALGFYAVMVQLPVLHLTYALVSAWNILNLIGSNTLFNHTSPIWQLSTATCNNWFGGVDLDRCVDNKFLQFLRVIGTSVIPFIAFTFVQALTYWAETSGSKGPGVYNRGSLQSTSNVNREGQGLVVQPHQSAQQQPPPV